MNIEETIKIMLKGVDHGTDKADIIDKLEKVNKENRPLRVKLGLDPTAPDIHLGHTVVLRKIKQLQDLGHTAVIIIGDFTGMIGDPTGKSKTRKQLSKEEVAINSKTYEEQMFKIIDKDKTILRFNSEWLGAMTFKDVVELSAKTTVARILERDDFTKRYQAGQPIGLHEFFYPLMQAYDSVAVEADIEIGGTDQVFNILMGRNIQKDYGQEPQITLFMPLLEGTDGIEKMSKSLGNYIGISEPANVMYEKVMKIPDGMIIKYYNLCTDIHPDIIDGIQKRLDNGENPRDIKMELAKEIVKLYHTEEEANLAEEHFKTAFQKQEIPEDAPVLNIFLDGSDVVMKLIDELVETGKYKSKGEIKRLFMQGAVKLNGQKISMEDKLDLNDECVLQIGKGNFYKIHIK